MTRDEAVQRAESMLVRSTVALVRDGNEYVAQVAKTIDSRLTKWRTIVVHDLSANATADDVKTAFEAMGAPVTKVVLSKHGDLVMD